jgi:1-acyl-sn-glycerol-3-phosphate acyltransferase
MDTSATPVGLARRLWQLPVGWAFTLVFTTSVVVIAIATLGLGRHRLMPALLRFWGRTTLAIQGVRVEVEGAEHLEGQAPRVATFNHASSIDIMLVPVVTPRGGVPAVKREMMYMPFIGAACYFMGFLFIDRGRSERARRTLARAATRVRDEGLTVFISPEGTRSPEGALLPFKQGAFRLAIDSGAPIVPVVISGAFELLPRGRFLCRQGTVKMRILPPVPTTGLTVDDLPALMASVREQYERALAELAHAA